MLSIQKLPLRIALYITTRATRHMSAKLPKDTPIVSKDHLHPPFKGEKITTTHVDLGKQSLKLRKQQPYDLPPLERHLYFDPPRRVKARHSEMPGDGPE